MKTHGKADVFEPSNGVLALAKEQFEKCKGQFPVILKQVASGWGVDLDETLDAKGIGPIDKICSCVICEVQIEKDTLRPIISLALRLQQAASHVSRKPQVTDEPFKANITYPEQLRLMERFRDALNKQIHFDPIEVYHRAILGTALLREEAAGIHADTAEALGDGS